LPLNPLTMAWGETHASGFWGVELKRAGFDGIIIKGKSSTPVYLYVHDGLNSELRDKLFGITIDYGHELMYAVEPAYTVYVAKWMGVPVVVTHINTAKWHSNDEDRVVGTGDIWHFVDFIYALLDTGYSSWFTLDQFTYRLNPVDGLRLSKELFANLYKRALMLYLSREDFKNVRLSGDQAKVLDYVKRIMYG